jgi:hypothetical protein
MEIIYQPCQLGYSFYTFAAGTCGLLGLAGFSGLSLSSIHMYANPDGLIIPCMDTILVSLVTYIHLQVMHFNAVKICSVYIRTLSRSCHSAVCMYLRS